MLSRILGSTGACVSAVGIGCGRIGSLTNPVTDRQISDMLARAYDLGVNLFDTADIYGQGDSERMLAKVFRDRRDKIYIVTKGGKRFSAKMRAVHFAKPVVRPLLRLLPLARANVQRQRATNVATDFSAVHLRRALDASLKRLQTDYVDCYLLHSPSANSLADPEIGAALLSMVEAGKVRHFGVSCDDMASLNAALKIPAISVLELPVTLIAEARATGSLERIRSLGVGILAHEVIALQPHLRPRDAARAAADLDGVTSVIVGLSKTHHLEDIASVFS